MHCSFSSLSSNFSKKYFLANREPDSLMPGARQVRRIWELRSKNDLQSKVVLEKSPQVRQFRLLGSGAAKEVYEAIDNQGNAIDNGLVYIVAKKSLLGSGLEREIEDAKEIKKCVYLGALESFFKDQGQEERLAKKLAKEVFSQFPEVELLAEALRESNQKPPSAAMAILFSRKDSAGISRLLQSHHHLAVDFTKEPDVFIHGQMAWSAQKAKSDLETAIRKNGYGVLENLDLAGQLIEGFQNLHAGSCLHGDPKLDNVLLYALDGKQVAKISDWGKCKKMGDRQVGIHCGNRRHMAPERLASLKGEVFGVGMMLVRILEEELLGGKKSKMLCSPGSARIDAGKVKQLRYEKDAMKCRKGIERFISILAKSPQVDSKPTDAIPHLIFTSYGMLFGNERSLKHVDVEIGAYLDKLESGLDQRYPERIAQIREVVGILRDMLQADPSRRVSMETAAKRWALAFQI